MYFSFLTHTGAAQSKSQHTKETHHLDQSLVLAFVLMVY